METLGAAADAAGLPDGRAFLADSARLGAAADAVRREIAARGRGINGVPHFSIGREEVSGAQPPDVFEALLLQAAAEQQ